MAEITLNCLIVPIGKLMNIPCVKVMQAITIEKDECYSILEATIQSRLGVEIPLKICIIQAGSEYFSIQHEELLIFYMTNISKYINPQVRLQRLCVATKNYATLLTTYVTFYLNGMIAFYTNITKTLMLLSVLIMSKIYWEIKIKLFWIK